MKEQRSSNRRLMTMLAGILLLTVAISGIHVGCSADQAARIDTSEAATNAADSSHESAAAASENTMTTPGIPREFAATAGDGQAELTWSEPDTDGGGAIAGYEVSSNGGNSYISASSSIGHTFIDLENDTAYDFHVRAVNEAGAGEYAAVSATPSATPSGIIIPPTVGETFADSTGFEWRVLTVEDDKALIITEHVHSMNTRYHSEDEFLPFQNAEIADMLNAWFDNDAFVSPGLRARALPYAFQHDDGTPGGNGVENQATEWVYTPSATNQQQARTMSGAAGSGDIAFILSTSEVTQYFAADSGARVALRVSETGAVGSAAYWWLRSPSTSPEYQVWLVGDNGYIYYDPATHSTPHLGFRPALWVNLL